MLREYRNRAKISQDKLSEITDLDKKLFLELKYRQPQSHWL